MSRRSHNGKPVANRISIQEVGNASLSSPKLLRLLTDPYLLKWLLVSPENTQTATNCLIDQRRAQVTLKDSDVRLPSSTTNVTEQNWRQFNTKTQIMTAWCFVNWQSENLSKNPKHVWSSVLNTWLILFNLLLCIRMINGLKTFLLITFFFIFLFDNHFNEVDEFLKS
jgi:hypothetical protein